MTYERGRGRFGGGEGASGATRGAPKIGGATLVQREPGPAMARPGGNALFDLMGFAPVQLRADPAADRGATRAAASIDAPAADSIEESRDTLPVDGAASPDAGGAGAATAAGPSPLSPHQLRAARRANPYWHRRLRFDAAAFGAGDPSSDDFAHAVARFQASSGVRVDGVAGHETCTAKGCLPAARPGVAAASSGSPAASPDAAATPDRSATRAAATLDAPAADSIEESRATLDLPPVQSRAATARDTSDADTHAIAAQGISGAGGAIPHADAIKASFGPAHAPAVDAISSHIGGPAATAAAAIGASAYATGSSVAFAASPDLHTAAHEAAHVVQQRQGVHLAGGVGQPGDPYELHADAVASAVVRGESASALLGVSAAAADGVDVQRKPDPAGLVLGAVADSPIRLARRAATKASTTADSALLRARVGAISPDHACLDIVQYVRSASDAVQVAGVDHLASAAVDSPADAIDRRATEEALDRLMSSALDLLGMARSRTDRSGNAPNVGAPTLSALLRILEGAALGLGWQAPHSVEESNDRASAQVACPPGSNMLGRPGCTMDDATRAQHLTLIPGELTAAGQAFFQECSSAKSVLEAAIQSDAAWAQAITDALISTLVVAGAGAAGAVVAAGTETTAATAGGKEAIEVGAATVAEPAAAQRRGTGLETLSLALENVAGTVTGEVTGVGRQVASGDPREATVSMLDVLANAVVDALKVYGETQLLHLNDDALSDLFIHLSGGVQPFRDAAKRFIARYRQQVEPIGAIAYDDPRMIDSNIGLLAGRGVAGTIAVWVVGAGPTPRLAIVKEFGATRANVMTGEMPPASSVLPIAYDFISWIDPQFADVVAARASTTVHATDVRGIKGAP